jgi:hypothetical protein
MVTAVVAALLIGAGGGVWALTRAGDSASRIVHSVDVKHLGPGSADVGESSGGAGGPRKRAPTAAPEVDAGGIADLGSAHVERRKPKARLAGRGNVARPTLAPPSNDLGAVDVAIGKAARAAFTVTAASRRLVLRPRLSNPTDFAIAGGCPSVLRARQSCRLSVSFAPEAAGRRTATLRIPRTDGRELAAALSGTGRLVAPKLTPSSHDFGTVLVGRRSAPVRFRLTAGSLPLSTRGVQTSGSREFRVDQGVCPRTLQPGSGCAIVITFAPASHGRRSATLSALPVSGSPLTARLTGSAEGNAVFGVGPNSLDFGSMAIGATSTKTVSITSHGPAPLRVAGVSVAGAGDFTATNDCPAVLAVGSSCKVRVTFTAASPAGRKTGALTIESGDGPKLDVALTGSTF